MITCSIGIMAYNEEANIGRLLEALVSQETSICLIKEIIVVASGCTDNTVNIVDEFCQKDKRIMLLIQETRRGKASAINLFLKHAVGEVVVFESADTIPERDVLEKLAAPFADQQVGMTGCQIVPVNSEDTVLGFYIHLFWKIHHRIGMIEFKTGEVTGMRNIIPQIPEDILTDETYLTSVILQKKDSDGNGYKLVYVPDAIVRNRGPETFHDFLTYRVRQVVAYYQLKHMLPQGYYIPKTMDKMLVFRCLLEEMTLNPKRLCLTFVSVLLEVTTRILAWVDWYVWKKNPFVWERVASTKRL
ncbi:MAG: glycosyltransferase [bacterium]|nr:glycosyltransferase [bacterium]